MTESTTFVKQGRFDQFSSLFNYFSNRPVVSVITLSGIVGSQLTIESMNTTITKAFKTKKLIAVCLVVNSPGGSPVQSELIAKKIMMMANKTQVPVYSFIEDVAASGGYWLACAADEIYASKSSIVGSIGVISSSFGLNKVIEKVGIERRVYTEGKNKSILDPFLPEQSQDIEILKKVQKQVYDHFVSYVKKRRKSKITQNDDVVFNGEFWAGQTALDFGLIDGIDDLYTFIDNKFGSQIKINHIVQKGSWIRDNLGISFSSIFQEVKERIKCARFDLY